MCDIYVGNYPNTYTADDVLELFDDFEGIILQRYVKKGQKCYSFLTCVDESQLLDVVTSMHNLIVDGRNLIVRAKDQDLQEIIEEALEEQGAALPLRLHESKTVHRGASQLKVNKTKFEDKYSKTKNGRYLNGCGYSLNKDHQAQKLSGPKIYGSVETLSSESNISGKQSSLSRDDKATRQAFSYVSVLNFPLGTSVQDLYKLFSDFDPVEIIMICNEPRMDRTLTEAVVCLSSEETAANAILNLDNTLYRRRIILVNDFKDFSLIP
ncbi:hypothetical protein X975_19012, partial [Stegodyphus mimosarum]